MIDAEHAPEPPGKKPEEESVQQDEEHASEHAEHQYDVDHGTRETTETTSLLPNGVQNIEDRMSRKAYGFETKRWDKMSPRMQSALLFLQDFLNPPLLGAVIGAIIGLAPPLHRAFFNDSVDGGFLNSWLTVSLSNIGTLFVSLQVIVTGVTLSSSLRKMKRGEDSGKVPWLTTCLVLLIRLVIWPAISISVVWALVTKTTLIAGDPFLWFAMMLMPTGPTAMKLIPMVDVSGGADDEKMSIAKLLTVSYIISPVLAFTVVGSLRASEAALIK